MSQLGRISGPLLKANLLRNGVDLAFENDLLYLDVTNGRIGINTSTPTHDLQVVGTTRTTNLEVTNSVSLADFNITGSTVTNSTGDIAFNSPVIINNGLSFDSMRISDNFIETTDSNANLELRTSGTGIVDIQSDLLVGGNLHVNGNITADGTISLGDSSTDVINFNAEIASDLIPDQNEVYQIGSDPSDSTGKRWGDLWASNLYADSVFSANIIIDGINLATRPGNTIYVGTTGDDTNNSGTHQNDPVLTVQKAVSLASAGDTIWIYPGTYEETFPIVIPQGVIIRGTGIRAVSIKPTAATRNKNAFEMNGETTVEDLAVVDFEYDSVNDTGYAFAFANNITVTSRSPYVRNISVLTKGSTVRLGTNPPEDPLGFDAGDAGRGAKINGSVANASSNEASMLFHSVTFITPGVDSIVALNGTRVEWLNSFVYYANRGMYLQSGTAGFAGDGKTRVKISNTTGTFAVNDTLTYYDTDGTTVLASGTIESISGDFYNIDGKVIGFETLEDRAGKVGTAYGNAQIDIDQAKFGVSSLLLDGIGDYLGYSTQPDFGFGTNDFTVEGWFRLSATGIEQTLFDFRNGSDADLAPLVRINTSNQVEFAPAEDSTQITGTTSLTSGTWYHIAVSKSSGSTKLFVNGTNEGVVYADSNDYGTSKPLTIGATHNAVNFFNGHIDDIRVSNVARYTSTFAVPSSAFTSDSNTLLLLHFNGTDGSTVIVDDGITTQDIRTTSGGTASKIDFANYSDFGVEVRSIGSANVYGNYGIYGDGDGVIAYLIGHNLAYIGAGKSSENDNTQVIQTNEVTELNRAKILYNTVDQDGDFRVGENFYVNQRTGEVSFSNSELAVTGNLTFTSGGDTTYIDATRIDTGNLRLSGNTVSSTSGDINVDPFTNQLNLNSDVTVTGDLNINSDATIGGNLILIGDIVLSAKIDSDIIPNADDTYNIGAPTYQWKDVYASRFITENIEIDNNKIRTLDSNSDLELEAAGNGNIVIENNDVVTQNIEVQGTTTLANTTINGALTQTGDQTITGSVVQTGDLQVDGQFSAGDLSLDAIDIIGNKITSTESNAPLELAASGTGSVDILTDLNVSQDITALNLVAGQNFTVEQTTTSGVFETTSLSISGNVINNTVSNDSLILRTSGTGNIVLDTTNVDVTNNLNVQGTTILSTTDITGTLNVTGDVTHTGDLNQTGSLNISENIDLGGYLQLDNIRVDTNYIATTESNSDLELRAAGTGKVLFPTSSVEINNDLDVKGSIVTSNLSVTGSITAPSFDSGDIIIENNVVTTTTSNSDLELRASGTGEILVPENNVQIDNDLTVSGVTDLQNTVITGTLTQTGNIAQTGDTTQTGNINLTGDFTSSGYVDLPDLLIETNFISTKTSNSDLELRANGTGIVLVPNNNVEFGQNLTVVGDITASDINITGVLSAPVISNGNIELDNNVITTTESNSDLELRANGTGTVLIPTNDLEVVNNFDVNGTATIDTLVTQNVNITGPVTHTGNYIQNGTQTLNGQLNVNDIAQFEEIQINTNFITTTSSNADLELRASGTGQVVVPGNDVTITQNLTVGGNITANGITVDQDLEADIINNGDIEIAGNLITTTLSNSNLELRANGAGVVLVPENNVEIDNDLTVDGITTLSDTTINGTLVHVGNTTQTGTTTITGDLDVNGDVNIDGFGQFSNIRIETNYISNTVTNQDLILFAQGTGKVTIPSNNVVVNNNLEVNGSTTLNSLTVNNTITSPIFNVGDLKIQGNVIENATGSIVLSASGTGSIELENIIVNENTISTATSNEDLVLQPNSAGYVDIDSNTSVVLPSGTTLERPSGQEGMIRYNTDFNGYEGYDGTAWRRLDGVYDIDQNTYITAELNPGSNDNVIRFYVNGALAATLDAQQLTANLLNVDDIEINNNTISTLTTNEDIVFAPNGTGSTNIGNFAFKNNTITNTVVDSVTVFNQTGANGYFKIDGTNGFVIPIGQDSERGALAEQGMIRFNTTDNRVEIYNGTNWISVAGAGGGVTITEAEDLSIRNALIFG